MNRNEQFLCHCFVPIFISDNLLLQFKLFQLFIDNKTIKFEYNI